MTKFREYLEEGKIPDNIKASVDNAKNFMGVGKELKNAKIKYDFSTSPLPIYMIKVGNEKWAIVNKKYADDADYVKGEIAVGKM